LGREAQSTVDYFLSANESPLTRLAMIETFTSTRLAILMKGMPPFVPCGRTPLSRS
jgi:hypothetical protein